VKRAAIIASVVALGMVAFVAVRRHAPRAKAATEEAQAAGPRRVRVGWPAGMRFVYRVEHRGDTAARLASQGNPIDGTWDVDLDLVARSFGDHDGATLLALSVQQVRREEATLGGKPVLTTDAARAAVVDGEVQVEIEPDGTLRSLRARPDASPVMVSQLRALLHELRFSLPQVAASTWQVHERNDAGEVISDYRLADGDEPRLSRSRSRYVRLAVLGDAPCDGCDQTLASATEVRLASGGWLTGMDLDERLTVQRGSAAPLYTRRAHLGLALLATDRFDASQLPQGFADVGLDERLDPVAVREQHLRHRVAGLTFERLAVIVDRYADGKEPPDAFAWRASGLLIQHPELCDQLAAQLEQSKASSRARELGLDLLASAGHAEAQSAMRAVLGAPAVQHDPRYVSLLQRVSFLAAPDGETASFIAAVHENASGEARLASAHALGSVAGKLATGGDRAGAERLQAPLLKEARDTRSSSERAALLRAIGNAHADENVPFLAGYARAREPEVRAAAITALRGAQADEARAALMDGLKDGDAAVQQAALFALGSGTMSSAELGTVADLARDATLGPGFDHELVSFFTAHAKDGDARAGLEALAARSTDREVQDRVRFVLAQLDANAAHP
jgi:hypothetical protein